MSKFVIWVDDDLRFIEPEIFDLKVLGFEVKTFQYPSIALDWIISNEDETATASAVIIDALLPVADGQFRSNTGKAAGILLYERLSKLPVWLHIGTRTVLYTRLPDGPRLSQIQLQADEVGVVVQRKSMTSRIAIWLRDNGRLK